MRRFFSGPSLWLIFLLPIVIAPATSLATTLRIAAYNIDADTSDYETNGIPREPYLKNTLQELGSAQLASHAQPLDVLAIEEPYGDPSVTLQAIVDDLNSLYPTADYKYASYVYSGPDLFANGNGPNSLIYNANTISDISVKPIGTTGSNRAAREPLRYTLQPVGYGTNAQFYMYVEHAKAKAGTDAGASYSNAYRRTAESLAVREDADSLPAGSHIIFAGDFNTQHSSENSYKNMTADPGANLVDGNGNIVATAGNGQAYDPVNPLNNWDMDDPAFKNIYTYSDTDLTRRYDYEFISNSVNPGTGTPGLQLITASYTAFGNSNDTLGGATTDTNLKDLTDHLPLVADYALVGVNPIPEPAAAGLLAGVCLITLRRRQYQL